MSLVLAFRSLLNQLRITQNGQILLFLKGGRYKFVLHMPRNETFSERSYQTASDAAEGAYNNLRVYIMSMLKNTPEYFVEYEKRPVRV